MRKFIAAITVAGLAFTLQACKGREEATAANATEDAAAAEAANAANDAAAAADTANAAAADANASAAAEGVTEQGSTDH